MAGVLAVLLIPAHLRAEPVNFPADPTSARAGIGGYVVERSGKTVDVQIKDTAGSPMASLEIEFDTPEGTVMNLTKGHDHLRLVWNSRNPTFSLTDLGTGSSASRTMEMSATHRITTHGSSGLLKKYEPQITLAFMVLDQTLTNLGLYEYFFGGPLLKPKLLERFGAHCPPGCDGPYIFSGFVAATSRSRCCEIATQGANNNCSNGICFGCCRIIGCDAACVGTTDYGCVCSVNGQACSDSPLTCDDTWPPSCT
ncbi:MAG: hypothetical protein QOJ16_1080 [Acidobacteriota bacterium]|jgi:hypothetical protein|nr:hypothetical protein [Acidobacteriota bacterium]